MGRSADTKKPQSLREKCSSWIEEDKAEREPQRPSVPPPRTPQPEMLRREDNGNHPLRRADRKTTEKI